MKRETKTIVSYLCLGKETKFGYFLTFSVDEMGKTQSGISLETNLINVRL